MDARWAVAAVLYVSSIVLPGASAQSPSAQSPVVAAAAPPPPPVPISFCQQCASGSLPAGTSNTTCSQCAYATYNVNVRVIGSPDLAAACAANVKRRKLQQTVNITGPSCYALIADSATAAWHHFAQYAGAGLDSQGATSFASVCNCSNSLAYLASQPLVISFNGSLERSLTDWLPSIPGFLGSYPDLMRAYNASTKGLAVPEVQFAGANLIELRTAAVDVLQTSVYNQTCGAATANTSYAPDPHQTCLAQTNFSSSGNITATPTALIPYRMNIRITPPPNITALNAVAALYTQELLAIPTTGAIDPTTILVWVVEVANLPPSTSSNSTYADLQFVLRVRNGTTATTVDGVGQGGIIGLLQALSTAGVNSTVQYLGLVNTTLTCAWGPCSGTLPAGAAANYVDPTPLPQNSTAAPKSNGAAGPSALQTMWWGVLSLLVWHMMR